MNYGERQNKILQIEISLQCIDIAYDVWEQIRFT